MNGDVRLREERPGDRASVLGVVARAFGDPTVATLWEDLLGRAGTTGWVAETTHGIVGHVGLSWGWIDAPDRLVDVLVLSPLSVEPARRRSGIGRSLVERAVAAADALAAPALFLEGDPAFYARAGFGPASAHGFTPPSPRIPPPAFQCVLLTAYDASVRGPLVYPDAFWAHDAVGLRGERLETVSRALGVEPLR